MKNAGTEGRAIGGRPQLDDMPPDAKPASLSVIYSRRKAVAEKITFGGIAWVLDEVEGDTGSWFAHYTRE
jgi:hypothetical protein